jgi:5-methylcytosine-specific restriction endonuclease McrA
MFYRVLGWIGFALRLVGVIGLLVGVTMLLATRESWIPQETDDQIEESVDHEYYGDPRSSEWQSVRKSFVKRHPYCEACGSMKSINVHHVEPFHLRPDLELDEWNLITLCRRHHFEIGHDPDGPWKPGKPNWSKSNPLVRSHAEQFRNGRRY